MSDIDKAVGNRIKSRRKSLKLSQTDLANRIGVKFQQVQKYETGSNRVAASRLWQIADALHVHISYFFEDIELLGAKTSDMTSATDINAKYDNLKRSLDFIAEPQRQAILALIETLQHENADQKPM